METIKNENFIEFQVKESNLYNRWLIKGCLALDVFFLPLAYFVLVIASRFDYQRANELFPIIVVSTLLLNLMRLSLFKYYLNSFLIKGDKVSVSYYLWNNKIEKTFDIRDLYIEKEKFFANRKAINTLVFREKNDFAFKIYPCDTYFQHQLKDADLEIIHDSFIENQNKYKI